MHRFVTKQTIRHRRHRRVRARIAGTAVRPRISVFRSAAHISVQLVDDATGRTLASASDREVTVPADSTAGPRKVGIARAVGKLLAERARANGVTAAVFDRGGYAYHGRVQAVADGAREGGLEF